MSKVSKIASFPHDLREQLNHRILDGGATSDLVRWLNELPAVKEILAGRFAGEPLKRQNLDTWRHTGYQRWLEQNQSILRLNQLGETVSRFSRADSGQIARGSAALLSGQLFELLHRSDQIPAADLLKIVPHVTSLIQSEQNDLRLQITRERVRQTDDQLLLIRGKHPRPPQVNAS
jgi:hypothetical protein